MIMRLVVVFLVTSFLPLSARFSFKDLFFKDYGKKELQDAITDLQNQQVNHPNDPKINYNLAVALYKASDYAGARENFKRALSFGKDTLALRERCYFNLGNTDYQQTLQMLGYGWESKKVEPQVLGEATKTITEAIENYKNVLVLNKQDEKAEKNKAVAEELLKKLKKKQAEQQKKDQNKDKDKKDEKDSQGDDSENKDGEESQDKKKDKKEDKDKKDDQNKEDKDSKKDEEQKKQDQQKGDQEKDKDKDKQEKKPEDKQEQPGKDKDEEQKEDSEQQSGSDKKKEQATPEQDKKEDTKRSEPEKTPSEEKKIQGQQQLQPDKQQEKKPEDSFEKRQAKAVLDSLEQQEADLQKALIFRNVHNRQQRQTTNQRPW